MLSKHDCDTFVERYTDVIKGLSALITRIDEDLQRQRAARRRTAGTESRTLKAES
jgi:hypothetical protein